MPGYAAQFAETESERGPGRNGCGIFVHAGGETDRVRKPQAEQIDWQSWRAKNRLNRITQNFMPARPGQRAHCSLVRLFRLLGEKNRPEHPVVKPTHAGFCSENPSEKK